MINNYYQLFEVPNFSNLEIVKKAYHRKAFLYHPDYGGKASAFQEIQSAWEILSTHKDSYDKSLQQSLVKPKCKRCNTRSCGTLYNCCTKCGSFVCGDSCRRGKDSWQTYSNVAVTVSGGLLLGQILSWLCT
mgnify:CR=1 FL=1